MLLLRVCLQASVPFSMTPALGVDITMQLVDSALIVPTMDGRYWCIYLLCIDFLCLTDAVFLPDVAPPRRQHKKLA